MDGQSNWAKELVEAIPQRHSARAYLPEALPPGFPDRIGKFFDGISVPFEHNARIEFFEAEPGKKLYNNGINPVNNIALLSQTDLVSVSKAGFVGQLVMLYTVSLGLSSCWFGHYKLSEVGKYIPGISTEDRIKESNLGYGFGRQVDVGERVICCMPFGRKNEETKRLVDFVAGKKAANRKPLAELLENPELAASIHADILAVLDLARLAPSAANSQMWRFGLDCDFKTITVAKPIGYRHFKWEHPDVDIGMCAAHIWLGLLDKGFMPEVEVFPDADRALWTFYL